MKYRLNGDVRLMEAKALRTDRGEVRVVVGGEIMMDNRHRRMDGAISKGKGVHYVGFHFLSKDPAVIQRRAAARVGATL